MAQQRISSVITTGRNDAIDQNFTDLYTTVSANTTAIGSASAAAAAALAAANSASASIAAFQAAWTSYTPTVTAGIGAFTSVSATGAYITNGKIVHFRASVAITTNGTAATSVNLTLPTTPASTTFTIAGNVTPGNKALIGRISGPSNVLTTFFYDGTYPGANGSTLIYSGTYQQA